MFISDAAIFITSLVSTSCVKERTVKYSKTFSQSTLLCNHSIDAEGCKSRYLHTSDNFLTTISCWNRPSRWWKSEHPDSYAIQNKSSLLQCTKYVSIVTSSMKLCIKIYNNTSTSKDEVCKRIVLLHFYCASGNGNLRNIAKNILFEIHIFYNRTTKHVPGIVRAIHSQINGT